jgi:hypothetical protein
MVDLRYVQDGHGNGHNWWQVILSLQKKVWYSSSESLPRLSYTFIADFFR